MPKRRVAVGEGGKAAGEQERGGGSSNRAARLDEAMSPRGGGSSDGGGCAGRECEKKDEARAREATSVWREARGSEEVGWRKARRPRRPSSARAPRSARYPHSLAGRDVRVNEAVREAGRSCLPRARECWVSVRRGGARGEAR